MTMLALIAIKLAQEVLALSARERWQATRNLSAANNINDIMTTRWFTITMVVVLVVSVIALFVVRFYKKVSERKAAEKEFFDNSARMRLTEPEADTLMAIAIKAGLKRIGDIFILSDTFDIGAGILLKESFLEAKPTNETSRLEKQLAGLQVKLGFRKVSSAALGGGGLVGSAEKPADGGSADSAAGKTAFIAMFPFAKKMDLINEGGRQRPQQGDSPPGLSESLPEFMPATVTGLVGRVLFIETTLSANVGDRVLVVTGSTSSPQVGPEGISDNDETSKLIEDIGIVEQSVQPARLLTEPNACRLSVALAGLSDTQVVQLAEAIMGAKTQGMAKQMMPAGSTSSPQAGSPREIGKNVESREIDKDVISRGEKEGPK